MEKKKATIVFFLFVCFFFSHSQKPKKNNTIIIISSLFRTRSSLRSAFENSISTPKVLLLSHPNNPLGFAYDSDTLNMMMDFCKDNDLHLVSDEIYATSSIGTNDDDDNNNNNKNKNNRRRFESAVSVASRRSDFTSHMRDRVHMVYALSKDFCLSGLRVGAAHTMNEGVLRNFMKLNDMCQVSSQTQRLCCNILDDEKWVEGFLRDNQEKVGERCNELTEMLDELRIPFLKADFGM